jgi:hypothetical protein
MLACPLWACLLAHWNAGRGGLLFRLLLRTTTRQTCAASRSTGSACTASRSDGRVAEIAGERTRRPRTGRAAGRGAWASVAWAARVRPGALVNGYLQADHKGDAFLKDGYMRALETPRETGYRGAAGIWPRAATRSVRCAVECLPGAADQGRSRRRVARTAHARPDLTVSLSVWHWSVRTQTTSSTRPFRSNRW